MATRRVRSKMSGVSDPGYRVFGLSAGSAISFWRLFDALAIGLKINEQQVGRAEAHPSDTLIHILFAPRVAYSTKGVTTSPKTSVS